LSEKNLRSNSGEEESFKNNNNLIILANEVINIIYSDVVLRKVSAQISMLLPLKKKP
jgi:hypothetical protein